MRARLCHLLVAHRPRRLAPGQPVRRMAFDRDAPFARPFLGPAICAEEVASLRVVTGTVHDQRDTPLRVRLVKRGEGEVPISIVAAAADDDDMTLGQAFGSLLCSRRQQRRDALLGPARHVLRVAHSAIVRSMSARSNALFVTLCISAASADYAMTQPTPVRQPRRAATRARRAKLRTRSSEAAATRSRPRRTRARSSPSGRRPRARSRANTPSSPA